MSTKEGRQKVLDLYAKAVASLSDIRLVMEEENRTLTEEEKLKYIDHVLQEGRLPDSFYEIVSDRQMTDYEVIGEQFGWSIADEYMRIIYGGIKDVHDTGLVNMCEEYLSDREEKMPNSNFYVMEIPMSLEQLENLEVTIRCR